MTIVQALIVTPFEYSAYDLNTSLSIQMKVYDVTAGYPGVLVATTTMVHIINGTYGASFIPAINKRYIINKSVFTDGTFTTLLGVYSPGVTRFYPFHQNPLPE